MIIKALSLHQPWATLWVYGMKQFETRNWTQRSIVGSRILVHATKNVAACREVFYREPFFTSLRAIGYTHAEAMPYGAIIGSLVVAEIYPTAAGDPVNGPLVYPKAMILNTETHVSAFATTQERAFGDWSSGRYAWLGTHRESYGRGVPARGLQGLWVVGAAERDAVQRLIDTSGMRRASSTT